SGNLDVVLEYWDTVQKKYVEVDSDTKLFNDAALWEPGYTEIAYLKVSNAGSLALKYHLAVNVYSETLGKTKTGADIKLSDYLQFKVVESDTDLAGTYDSREAAQAAPATATKLQTYSSDVKALEKTGDTDYIALIIYMPTTVDNKANHDGKNIPKIEMGVNLFATQQTYENDSFNNQYDKNAIIVTNAAEAQAALDNAEPGATIKLVPGVNYGTLYLRPVAGAAPTKEVDWQGNNYRFETYSLFENLTIVGATGATVDAIKIEGGTYYNTAHSQSDTYPVMLSLIELKNVVIDGVTFTGNGGQYGDSHGNAISLAGNNIKVDGLTIKNCVLEDPTNNNRLLYKSESTTHVHTYEYDGETYTFTPSLKDIVVTDCTFNGGYMGLELRETENVTITNNVFNVGDRNILLTTNSGCTYTGNVTITGNVSNNAKQRFVRADAMGDAVVVVANNTINNYMASDADYIKVTNGNNVTVENNTLVSIGVKDAAALQAALDNAVAGTTIQLQPGVNYGTLVFGRNASSQVVDISHIGGDETGNERYSRYENITILGAAGATVDQITFDNGREDANTIWNYIDVKNLTIKNVTFSGASTAVMIPDGFDIAIDGLSLVNCKMTDTEGDDRFVYQPRSGYKTLNDKTTGEYVMTSGVKNLTITGCEVTGAYQVVEARPMENITITDNTFKGIKKRDILLSGGNELYTGTVTVTGNKSFDGEDRFLRATNMDNATVVVKDNVVTNYLGKDANFIKVDKKDGTDITDQVATNNIVK
ncbi:MAG: hypothetical protein IIV57_02675, partial [Bacteroidaceae bacterium]|nr:hypothetical protein [Bacteroidaceae bacterium]